jgi:hypothetical protein
MLLRDPHEWTLDQVERFVAEQIPEGQRIEYKASLQLESKRQKAELAKDISGFANAQGGWIFFGVAEDDSAEPLPSSITPIPATGLQTKLENILDTTLEPIPSYVAATVQIDGAGVVILVRVAAHSGRPVMVQGYDQHRYFVRSGTRTRPMNANEVADAHMAASQRASEVHQKLADLPLRSDIAEVQGMHLITSPDLPWLPYVSVVVAAIDGKAELIDREQITQDSFSESTEGYRSDRTVRSGHRWAINAFGLLDELSDPPPPQEQSLYVSVGVPVSQDDERFMHHRVAIYRAGVVEWAHRYPEEFGIPSRSFADDVHNSLLYAARVFDEVGFAGPVMLWVRIENAENAQLLLARDADLDARTPGIDVVGYSTEVEADRLLIDPTPTVHDAMHAIWQGFGLDRCSLFDAAGSWRN